MELIVHTAGSQLAVTEIHVMQGEPYDWTVLEYGAWGNFSAEEIASDPELPADVKEDLAALLPNQTYIGRDFAAGTYYIVANGVKVTNGGVCNGVLTLNVAGWQA